MSKLSLILGLSAVILLFCTSSCTNSEQKIARDLERASQLEQEGKIQEAITLLQALNTRWPGRAEILEPLAFAYSHAKEYDFAAFTFAQIAEIKDQNDLFYLQAGEHALLAGDEESAIRHYQAFLLHNPNDANAWEQLGILQKSRNFYQDAAESFMRKYKLEPSGATAIHIAQSFLALGNLTQAERWYQTASESGAPYEQEALVGLVETAFVSNQTDKLESYLETIKQRYPEALEKEELKAIATQMAAFQAEREALNRLLQDGVASATAAESATESTPETTVVAEVQTEAMEDTTSNDTAVAVAEETMASTESAATEPAAEVTESAQTTTDNVASDTPTVVEETVMLAEEDTTQTTTSQAAKTDLPADLLAEVEASLKETEPSTAQPTTDAAASPAEMLESSYEEVTLVEGPASLSEDASLVEQARHEYQSGNFEKASELYWSALSNDSSDPAVWFELSNAFLKQEQYGPARAAALEAMRRDPQNLLYVFQNLRILQRTTTPERFLRELQETRQRFPRSPDVALALARAYDRGFQDKQNSEYFYRTFLQLAGPEHPSRNEANLALGLPLEDQEEISTSD